jgi:hypothetical protein
MKKKLLICALALVMCITLVGCGKAENNNNQTNNGSNVNEKYEYTYKDGVLTTIVDEEGKPKQTDFVIDGIILVGNRHEYRPENSSEEIIDYLVGKGYNKENLNKDFYLNEWIEFYIDTKYSKPIDDVKIIVVPHRTVEELEKLSLTKLEELATENGGFVLDYKNPEESEHKLVGSGYVHQDSKEGKYDILFTYKGKLAYFININLTKEPTE